MSALQVVERMALVAETGDYFGTFGHHGGKAVENFVDAQLLIVGQSFGRGHVAAHHQSDKERYYGSECPEEVRQGMRSELLEELTDFAG